MIRVLQVIPKEIEIVISFPVEDLRRLEAGLCVGEFSLDQNIPSEKEIFDSIINFHNTLKSFLKDFDND